MVSGQSGPNVRERKGDLDCLSFRNRRRDRSCRHAALDHGGGPFRAETAPPHWTQTTLCGHMVAPLLASCTGLHPFGRTFFNLLCGVSRKLLLRTPTLQQDPTSDRQKNKAGFRLRCSGPILLNAAAPKQKSKAS